MVNYTMSGQNESDVESLLMSPCWNQSTSVQDQYILDGHKLLLDAELESLPSDSETQKSSMDVLENLLLNSTSINSSNSSNDGDVKPLPSFTSFNTGHLSINGISGYHYTAIAQRLPEENNNYSQNSFQNGTSNGSNGDNNIVSSSTCLPDSVMNPDGNGADSCLQDVKLFSDSSIDGKIYSTSADSCVISGPDSVSGARIFVDSKELSEYDMSSIEDIAAIIGSAIADTTVPNNKVEKEDGNDTRDSWMDLDAWIEGTCTTPESKLIVSQQDSLSELILPHSPVHTAGSTLQSLLTHGYMPLLQNRLQNGPPIKIETPTSTSYCGELISTSTSPPGSVVSTTDNLILNGRYLQNHQNSHFALSMGLKPDGLCSPDLMGNFPHTTSTTPTTPKNKRRPHKQSKTNGHGHPQVQQGQQSQQNSSIQQSAAQQCHQQQLSAAAAAAAQTQAALSFQAASELSGLLGKDKPVHRCNICNRGFLNKSNIKVHLRTHTGEKPFRCEVCAKAFRQKAHLIKHQQIHKRIGRD
ncbi:ichor [Malaya genurostris]|uniref:ichor n=1 Tax=Malaya genurostris TaxID=325434 RepID=UPI0026F3EE40|nr:ichor [Malaya genurostris]XP_058451737.1 ichor [Malaya genurostris]XP_058451738.1 ichor [Malaya genurostris]XP_058451739.1 ichor [Malaya genurostris]